MLEFHGWMTIRETYKVVEDEEENISEIINFINNAIDKMKWNKVELKVANGEWYLEISLFSNRRTEQVSELFDLFTYVSNLAIGSYGLIYMLDEADKAGKNNEFQVYSISRGAIHNHQDKYLSPFIPVVEDADF